MDTDYDLTRGLCQRACGVFPVISLHRCGQSVVQATTLLLAMQIVVLVNAHLAGLLSSITSCCEFI